MKKTILSLLLLFLIGYGFFLNPSEALAGESYTTTAPILDTAEKFFISLKQRQYSVVWDLLSTKSHKTIINDIYKASKKLGENLEKTTIKNDFKKRGVHSNSYWDAILTEFDPDIILEDSRWEMGPVNKDKAEIILLHKKSKNPAILQMFKENEGWKVGFSESFKDVRF